MPAYDRRSNPVRSEFDSDWKSWLAQVKYIPICNIKRCLHVERRLKLHSKGCHSRFAAASDTRQED